MKVYRFRNWRSGLYWDEEDEEFTSSIGVLYEDEGEARADFDAIAREMYREGVSFYDYYADHEIVISALDDIGTLEVRRQSG